MVDKVEKKWLDQEERSKISPKEKEKAEKPRSILHRRKGYKQKSFEAIHFDSMAESDPKDDDDDTVTCPVCFERQ